jgi:hypothetical protein
VGGFFFKTIKRVNAVEVKRKQISDNCAYLMRYLMKLKDFKLTNAEHIQICKEFHIGVKREFIEEGVDYNGIEIMDF